MNPFRRFVVTIVGLAMVGAFATPASAAGNRYQQDNLVSDVPGAARHVDGNLQNAWGIAFNPTAVVWVADNGTAVSTLYDGQGNPQSLVVKIPGPPTGIVFNPFAASALFAGDFVVTKGTLSGPSVFIFATEDGTLAGWAPGVDRTNAILVPKQGSAVYKGLALASNGTGNFLYAADFFGRKIDVYDRNFNLVTMPGGFVDRSLPENFAPFNVQNILGDLYVAYALRKPGETDETKGEGLGFVNVFDANGNLIRRVASRGALNAPWGIAMAPASFGRFANRLLVGNFGDGTINAFDTSGGFKGQLHGLNGRPLKIDGLWGLAFGNGVLNQPTSTLYFTAGPDDEKHGLYGAITSTQGGGDDGGDGDDGDH